MRDWRQLHLKIRVVTTRAMPAAEARLLVERAFQDRAVPPGIAVYAIDWAKGNQDGDALSRDEFRRVARKFRGAVQHGKAKLRFALVSEGETLSAVSIGKRSKPFRSAAGVYRDARGRFISKATYKQFTGKKFTKEEEELLGDMRRSLQDARVGKGAEFEWTITTKGGTPRKDGKK